MYVPAPPAQPAPALAAAGFLSSELSLSAPIARYARSGLRVSSTNLNVLAGQQATVAGTLRPGLAGRIVTLQAFGRDGWGTTARAITATSGRFRLRLLARHTGSQRVRLRFAGDTDHLGSSRRLGTMNVYRSVEASWYGGGGGLACGGWLTAATMGVANRTLPCGTLVTLRYSGHTVRVPVIDRGPYVGSREFDLTEATKLALGFGDTGMVWTTS
jgi:peptidoglycan lytic transglycosylase